MPGFISDSPLARELIRIGDEATVRENDGALRAYFADGYVFHSPGDGLSFDELTGQHVEWEAINTFRYDDDGQLAEEWVQTDYRSLLTKLGVTSVESVSPHAGELGAKQLPPLEAHQRSTPSGAALLTGVVWRSLSAWTTAASQVLR